MSSLDPTGLERLLLLAIEEDIRDGDVTAVATIDNQHVGSASIKAKQDLVVAGLEIMTPLWQLIDPEVTFKLHVENGEHVKAGSTIASLDGRVRSLLAGERICLNFLGRLCGIATQTARYVQAARGHRAKILDTRKTTPGLRILEKAAVKAGGGHNHRMGLYDQILIKDNHIDAVGGVGPAIESARRKFPQMVVEVEVRNRDELQEALAAGADIILLDNMSKAEIAASVELSADRAELEASGGVTLDDIAELAATGVHRISVGALTHSVTCADLNMKLGKE